MKQANMSLIKEKGELENKISVLETQKSTAEQKAGQYESQVVELEAQKSSLEVLLKVANEQITNLAPLTTRALMLRRKIYQMQVQSIEKVLKVRQEEDRLEEILVIASQFRDKTQNVMEIIQGRLTWLETTKEPPENTLVKDSERIHLEYELIGFGNKAVEKLVEAVKKTNQQCMEFCEKVLTTHNMCQTSSKKRLDGLPVHEEHLKQLHAILQEDELGI